jgi:hypothetical protein
MDTFRDLFVAVRSLRYAVVRGEVKIGHLDKDAKGR